MKQKNPTIASFRYTHRKIRLVRNVDVVLPGVILWQNTLLDDVPVTESSSSGMLLLVCSGRGRLGGGRAGMGPALVAPLTAVVVW